MGKCPSNTAQKKSGLAKLLKKLPRVSSEADRGFSTQTSDKTQITNKQVIKYTYMKTIHTRQYIGVINSWFGAVGGEALS